MIRSVAPVVWFSLSAASAFGLAISTATADEIAYELFDEEVGDLDGQDGGEGWGSAWSASFGLATVVDTSDAPLEFDVPGGGLVRDEGRALELIGNADEIVHRELEESYSGDEVYVGFLFRFEGVIHSNDFLGLWLDEFLGGTHTEAPNIGLKGDQNGLGPLDLFARVAINRETYSEDIVPGETYLVVGRLWKSIPGEFEPFDRYDLWVNPAYGDDESPRGTSSGFSLSRFSLVGVRVPTFDREDRALIGSLRLGTEWDDVVPSGDDPDRLEFRRGDADGTGALNLSDAVFTLNHLFLAGPAPACEDAADTDDNGSVNLTDAVLSLNHLFLQGPPPAAPGATDCGIDPTEDALSCAANEPCA